VGSQTSDNADNLAKIIRVNAMSTLQPAPGVKKPDAVTPSPEKSASMAVPQKNKIYQAKPLQKEEVFYLAFEGGGGKGVTYLGAIQALEELKILPSKEFPDVKQIRGLSGASAGAITALVLALGYKSADVETLLKSDFKVFFDAPKSSYYRLVDLRDDKKTVGRDSGVTNSIFESRMLPLKLFGNFSVGVRLVSDLLKPDGPILNALSKDIRSYLYNLIYDRGLFPGFAVREFFHKILRNYYKNLDETNRSKVKSRPPETMTFIELYSITGLELAFTGVNTTNAKSQIWSHRTTPDFPVAEAVAISMNLPVLFKPVRVVNSPKATLDGYWIDGGVQNNLPFHVFDELEDNENRGVEKGLSGLHSNVLALRLSPTKLSEADDITEAERLAEPYLKVFKAYISNLLDTILAPSEEAQFRTPDERNQTIELFTENLETADFSPPPEKSRSPIENAKKVVGKYFEERLTDYLTPEAYDLGYRLIGKKLFRKP
jgi:predicted acylesterase/phospholipase RssA